MMQTGRGSGKAWEKERNRERKKRGNRKYGQARLRPSKKGIISCMVSGVTGVLFITLVFTAFLHKGHSAAIIGSFGLFAVVLSVIGLITAIRGFRERDKNYTTCKIGVGVNGFVLLSLVVMFIRGIS